jgi:hypothetical protein
MLRSNSLPRASRCSPHHPARLRTAARAPGQTTRPGNRNTTYRASGRRRCRARYGLSGGSRVGRSPQSAGMRPTSWTWTRAAVGTRAKPHYSRRTTCRGSTAPRTRPRAAGTTSSRRSANARPIPRRQTCPAWTIRAERRTASAAGLCGSPLRSSGARSMVSAERTGGRRHLISSG